MKNLITQIKKHERSIAIGTIVTTSTALLILGRSYINKQKMLDTLLTTCEELGLVDQITEYLEEQ